MVDITTRAGKGSPLTFAELDANFTALKAAVEALLGNSTPAAPVFGAAPSISPTSGNVGATFTATDGTVTGGTVTARRWLLSGTAIGTGTTVVPVISGSLVLENTAVGIGGTTVSTSSPVTVAAATIAPGVATITSPSTVSQPAATQRFFVATADRSGTWSKGTGSNASDFTIDATTGIYSVNANAAGDGTTQLVKALPLVFTPDDGTGAVSQTVTATLQAPVTPQGVLSATYTAPFNGMAGTALQTLAGWAVDDSSIAARTPTLDGNGHLVGNDATGGATDKNVLYDFGGSSLAGQQVTYTVKQPSGSGSINFLFAYSSASTVLFQATSDQTAISGTLYYFAGGPNVQGVNNVAWRDDGTLDVVFSMSADGATVYMAINGKTTASYSYSVPVGSLGTTTGFHFGGAGPAMSANQTIIAINAIKAASSLSITSAPAISATNTANVSFTWGTTKPTAIEYRLIGANGTPTDGTALTGWLIADATINNDGTGSFTVTAPGASTYQVRARPRNDTAVIATAPTTTRFLYTPYPFAAGYNMFGPNYYIPFSPLNDWGKTVLIGGGQVIVSPANITTLPGQIDTVTTDVGASLVSTSDSTLEIVHTDPATGTHQVRVNGDVTPGASRYFTVGGAISHFTVQRGGTTGKIAPEWIAGMEGVGWRDLDCSGGNHMPARLNQATDALYAQYAEGADLPYQDLIDAHAAKCLADPNFRILWHVFPGNVSDADVTAFFTYWRDHPTLPSTAKLLFTYSNEVWNPGFSIHDLAQVYAMARGIWGGATYDTLKPAKTIIPLPNGSSGYFGEGSASNTDGPAASAGQWVLYQVDGVDSLANVYEAKTNLSAGTTIGDNANWLRRPEVRISANPPAWYPVRHNDIINIGMSVMGATRFAEQCKPVVDGWQIQPLYDYLQTWREFVPGYFDKVWGVGFSHYLNVDTSWPADASPTISSMDTWMRAGMASSRTLITQMVADCIRMGKVPVMYEGGLNGAGKSGLDTAHLNLYTQYITTDPGRLLMQDHATWLKANVPGIVMFYTLAGYDPWSLKTFSWTDNSSALYRGWKAGLAA